MSNAVIVSGVRTAVGAFGGSLKDVPAKDLGALVIHEAVRSKQGSSRRCRLMPKKTRRIPQKRRPFAH